MDEGLRSEAELVRAFGPCSRESMSESKLPLFLPASHGIEIIFTSEIGMGKLNELVDSSLPRLGRQIFREISYNQGSRNSILKLKVNPGQGMLNLYELLVQIACNVQANQHYMRILSERERILNAVAYAKYLGFWTGGSFEFRGEVGSFLCSGYEHCENRYEAHFEEIMSASKKRNVSRARGGLFYALSKRFPSSYGSGNSQSEEGLSTTDIGKIFGRDHSTVVSVLKKINEKVVNSEVEDHSLVNLLVDEGFRALDN